MSFVKLTKKPINKMDCDHYWLVRRGGRCHNCGLIFPGNLQKPR